MCFAKDVALRVDDVPWLLWWFDISLGILRYSIIPDVHVPLGPGLDGVARIGSLKYNLATLDSDCNWNVVQLHIV